MHKAIEDGTGWPDMRAVLPLAVLANLLAAGCATPDEGPTFALGGSFTAEFDSADRADFNAVVAPYSDDVAFLESFPEQFSIRGITGGCEQLRATLQAKPYVATVGTCRAESASADDPDGATSSG